MLTPQKTGKNPKKVEKGGGEKEIPPSDGVAIARGGQWIIRARLGSRQLLGAALLAIYGGNLRSGGCLSTVCSENPGLSGRYHAGLWSGKRWSCCRLSTRSAEGCDTCSSWSSKSLNATNPSSTSTSSFNSAPGTTVATSTTAAITDQPQTNNSEANNNPIVHSQARSTIGSYIISFLHFAGKPTRLTRRGQTRKSVFNLCVR